MKKETYPLAEGFPKKKETALHAGKKLWRMSNYGNLKRNGGKEVIPAQG